MSLSPRRVRPAFDAPWREWEVYFGFTLREALDTCTHCRQLLPLVHNQRAYASCTTCHRQQYCSTCRPFLLITLSFRRTICLGCIYRTGRYRRGLRTLKNHWNQTIGAPLLHYIGRDLNGLVWKYLLEPEGCLG